MDYLWFFHNLISFVLVTGITALLCAHAIELELQACGDSIFVRGSNCSWHWQRWDPQVVQEKAYLVIQPG